MRSNVLVFALVCVACGSETPSPAVDAAAADVAPLDSPGPVGCTPGRVEACPCPGAAGGAQTCLGDGTFGPCVCPDAGIDVADVDVVDERPAPDAAAPMDATADITREATADTSPCRAGETLCDTPGNPNACRDLQRGVLISGMIYSCGRCNNACSVGSRCVEGMCE